MNPVIIDTGPLVAWFCVRDAHHEWAVRILDTLPAGGLVCESVLTEACHLVARDGANPEAVLKLVENGDLVLIPLNTQMAAIRSLMKRYADTPMDFADACVTRLAEMHGGSTVCTTDSDFLVYRKNRSETIPLLAPFGE
jgi:uncharacterized protein